jgi:hypothetical protein
MFVSLRNVPGVEKEQAKETSALHLKRLRGDEANRDDQPQGERESHTLE